MAMSISERRIRNEFQTMGHLHARGFIGHPIYSGDGSSTVTAYIESRLSTPLAKELLIITMTFSSAYPYQRLTVLIEILNRNNIAQHVETSTGHSLDQNWTPTGTIEDILNFVSR